MFVGKKSLCFPRPVCLDCFEELGFFKFINIHASWAFLSVKEKLAYSIFCWKEHGYRENKNSKFFSKTSVPRLSQGTWNFSNLLSLSLLSVLEHERKLAYFISCWNKHACGEKNFSKCVPWPVCLNRLRDLGISKIY